MYIQTFVQKNTYVRFQDAKFSISTVRPEDPGVVIGPQGVRYVLGEVPR